MRIVTIHKAGMVLANLHSSDDLFLQVEGLPYDPELSDYANHEAAAMFLASRAPQTDAIQFWVGGQLDTDRYAFIPVRSLKAPSLRVAGDIIEVRRPSASMS